MKSLEGVNPSVQALIVRVVRQADDSGKLHFAFAFKVSTSLVHSP